MNRIVFIYLFILAVRFVFYPLRKTKKVLYFIILYIVVLFFLFGLRILGIKP